MNTFTFTDDELGIIKSSLKQYTHNLSSFNKLFIDSGVSYQQINKNIVLANQSLSKLDRPKEK